MTTEKMSGRIIKLNKAGWGFISSKEIEFTRIFFHWTSLRQDTLSFPELKTGMVVEFMPVQVQEKGFRAVHVKVTDDRKKKSDTTSKEMETTHEVSQLPE